MPDIIQEFQASEPAVDLSGALARAVRGSAAALTPHLFELERDLVVGATRTKLHVWSLPHDAHGRPRFKPLAEFLRDRIVDYAIPRRTIEQAQAEAAASGSTAAILRLERQARRLFTTLAQSGEGGELLLFAIAESIFGLAQILCKMSLKTSASMHYHGADGVYAEGRSDGGLNIYWGESKIYADATSGIRACLESLAPFLIDLDSEQSTRQRDILLVNEFANFTDERLVDGLRRALDMNDVASLSTQNCGFALVAFDSNAYGFGPGSAVEQVEHALREEFPRWAASVEGRVAAEKLELFAVHFICVPMPSAAAFRSYFLSLLGVEG